MKATYILKRSIHGGKWEEIETYTESNYDAASDVLEEHNRTAEEGEVFKVVPQYF